MAINQAMLLAMNKNINIAEFKNRLSEVMATVEKGGEVIICRRNVPMARIQAIVKPSSPKPRRTVVGCMKGTLTINGDLTEPCIPESDWENL